MESDTLARKFDGATVLVTGHTSFKGVWLCLWLRRLGATVVGYSRGPHTAPNLADMVRLNDAVQHVEGDILDLDSLRKAVDDVRPHYVFHLAAQAIVGRGKSRPLDTFKVNALGTANLCEALRWHPGLRGAVFVTTDKVYEPASHAHREDDPLGGPDAYSASKAAAEHIVAAYASSYCLPYATGRAGNVIGGGDFGNDRLVPNAVRAARAGETLWLAHSHAIRPWQYVLEPVHGYLHIAGAKGEAYNFGPAPGDLHTVGQLAEMFRRRLGHDFNIAINGDPPAENTTLMVDINKACRFSKWRPVYNTEQALHATARWYDYVLWRKHDALEATNHELDEYIAAR